MATGNTFNITGAGGLVVSIPLMDRVNGQGPASLVQTGNGLMVFAALNTYSGGTTISGGTLALADANALPNSTVTLNVNGGLAFAAGGLTYNVGSLAGSGNLALTAANGGAVTLSLGGNGASSLFSGVLSGAVPWPWRAPAWRPSPAAATPTPAERPLAAASCKSPPTPSWGPCRRSPRSTSRSTAANSSTTAAR